MRDKRGLQSLATLRDVVTEDPALLGLTAHDDGIGPREKLASDTADMWKSKAA